MRLRSNVASATPSKANVTVPSAAPSMVASQANATASSRCSAR